MNTNIPLFLLAAILLISACSSSEKGRSQTHTNQWVNTDTLIIYKQDAVDEEPKLVGGQQRLAEQMVYPQQARQNGISGEVLVKFIVLKTGEDVNHMIARRAHHTLNKAAIKTVEKASFEPGIKDGKPVHTQYKLSLKYRSSISR